MSSPEKTLRFALEKYAGEVELVSLRELVVDSARRNDKRPAWVKLAVPDEVVKELRGRPGEGDLVLLVRVPKAIADRQQSKIILPGEAG